MDARHTTFQGLYRRYDADVYRFAQWLTANPHDASQDYLLPVDDSLQQWPCGAEPHRA